MRRAIIAVLALAGCSPPAVEQIGPHQYMVTAPPKEVWAKVGETCAKLGKMATSISFGGNPETQLKFECVSPYEIVPIDSYTLTLYGDPRVKGSYKIWVPSSEFHPLDGCVVCVPPHPPTVEIRVEKLASDYCAKMSMTMKQTGGSFNGGSGLQFIFSCVPSGQGPASHFSDPRSAFRRHGAYTNRTIGLRPAM
jgi:hypothetical protein